LLFFIVIFFGIFFYKDYMRYLFTKRIWLVVILLTLFSAAIYEFALKIPKDFIPSEEQNQFTVFVELSSGVKLDLANKVAKEAEQKVSETKELKDIVENISSKVEGWSIKVFVTLVPKSDRKFTTEEVINILRKNLKDVGREYDGFVYFSKNRSAADASGFEPPLDSSPDRPDEFDTVSFSSFDDEGVCRRVVNDVESAHV